MLAVGWLQRLRHHVLSSFEIPVEEAAPVRSCCSHSRERKCSSWITQSLLNLKLRHGMWHSHLSSVGQSSSFSGTGKHPRGRCCYTTRHMALGRGMQYLQEGGWTVTGSSHSTYHMTPQTPQRSSADTQIVGHFLTPSKSQGSWGWFSWTWSPNISYHGKQILIVWDLEPLYRPLFFNLIYITPKPNSGF